MKVTIECNNGTTQVIESDFILLSCCNIDNEEHVICINQVISDVLLTPSSVMRAHLCLGTHIQKINQDIFYDNDEQMLDIIKELGPEVK